MKAKYVFQKTKSDRGKILMELVRKPAETALLTQKKWRQKLKNPK